MMKSLRSIKWFFVLTATLFAASCGTQSETVVVNENPEAAATDTSSSNITPTNQADFKQITMASVGDIGVMDPLFADNMATMQALQLVYEGLVRFNAQGKVVPALAKSWSVSDDGKTYTFQLRSDVYYQDSNQFSSGTGRKFTASDVAFVFKRMAHADVPPTAARMFMDIQGFEPYFNEQHYVYNPDNRQLKDISGITTPDDNTVRFTLAETDDHFLEKLATPLALIYPHEAVGNTVNSFSAIGTGPFMFSQKMSDTTYTFARNKSYYSASGVNLNRIDIEIAPSEKSLMKGLQSGEIQVVPQLGPGLMQSMLNDNGQLAGGFSDRYQLKNPGGNITYKLAYNSRSELSADQAGRLAQLMHDNGTAFADQFPDDLVTPVNLHAKLRAQSPSLPQVVQTTYAGDPFEQQFLHNINQQLNSQQVSLKAMNMRTPVRSTGLFFTRQFPLMESNQDLQTVYAFQVRHLALQRTEISNVQFNQYPWWLNLRATEVAADANFK